MHPSQLIQYIKYNIMLLIVGICLAEVTIGASLWWAIELFVTSTQSTAVNGKSFVKTVTVIFTVMIFLGTVIGMIIEIPDSLYKLIKQERIIKRMDDRTYELFKAYVNDLSYDWTRERHIKNPVLSIYNWLNGSDFNTREYLAKDLERMRGPSERK